MADYFRSAPVKLYDPDSVEYSMFDAIIAEQFETYSYDMYLFAYDHTTTSESLNTMDEIYGENFTGDAPTEDQEGLGNVYKKPQKFCALTEKNPILKELTRLGLEEIEEIDIYVNISDFLGRTGSVPTEGDYILISYLSHKQKTNKFYKVANVTEVDEFNGRFMNFHIFSEQTNTAELPDEVQKYLELL